MSREARRSPRWSAALRIALRVVAAAGVVLAVIAVRVVLESRAALEAGRALEAEGAIDRALVEYRRSAAWYAPGSPYSSEALDRIFAIASAAESDGDRAKALLAWRSARAAILSARSFYTPHEDALATANERIAALAERSPGRPSHRELLRRTTRPHVGYMLVLLAGFFTWVASAFVFSWRAIDDEDQLVPGEARRWGTAIILGLGLFVLGLALA